MHRFNTVILFIIAVPIIAIAQPPEIAWMRMYDNGSNETFNDIYAVSSGGYVMCGSCGTGCLRACILCDWRRAARFLCGRQL